MTAFADPCSKDAGCQWLCAVYFCDILWLCSQWMYFEEQFPANATLLLPNCGCPEKFVLITQGVPQASQLALVAS